MVIGRYPDSNPARSCAIWQPGPSSSCPVIRGWLSRSMNGCAGRSAISDPRAGSSAMSSIIRRTSISTPVNATRGVQSLYRRARTPACWPQLLGRGCLYHCRYHQLAVGTHRQGAGSTAGRLSAGCSLAATHQAAGCRATGCRCGQELADWRAANPGRSRTSL